MSAEGSFGARACSLLVACAVGVGEKLEREKNKGGIVIIDIGERGQLNMSEMDLQ